MAQARALVRNGMLAFRDGELDHVLPVGGTAWERWLEQPDTKTFRFEHGAARFTARREQQRGHWYWYAYRRQGGRLQKAYLGRAGELTLDRLQAMGNRLFEAVGSSGAPASRGTPAARLSLDGRRHNLPGEVSSFLGREWEIAEVHNLLQTTRLLTLTGSGGVGKTRLALQVASGALEDAANAVWLVELAALTDPTLVPQAVAQAVGARQEPGQPLLATLAAALGGGRVLLILDNCEHLVDACAHLAEHLLRACPGVRILATSRQPLGVPGEVSWRVPSLDLPDARDHVTLEKVAQAEAVQLFVERAHAARPGFSLTVQNAPAVAETCRQLDGIPLAIELAAARVRVLSPDEILSRLGDRFRLLAGGTPTVSARQQTLRSAVEWSYDLLMEPERSLFERLSVFAGGFTLDAAEAVCVEDTTDPRDIFDLLSRLVDRSLVLAEPQAGAEPTRFRLLETLRAYGLERLADHGEADRTRERHAEWITTQAEQAQRAFYGPEQGRWLRWAEREHDNVRAALSWARACERGGLAQRLAAALSWSWIVHQRWDEGMEWVQRILSLRDPPRTRERGLLLTGAANLAAFRGDLASNRPSGDLSVVGDWLKETLSIGQEIGDDELVLAAHGFSCLVREFGLAIEGLPEISDEETLEESRRIGHTWGICRGLESQARNALRAGDLDTAYARLEEAVDLARAAGDFFSLAMLLNELGDVERARSAHAPAGKLYAESLALFADLGLGDQPNLVHNLGYVALAAGNPHLAAARFAQALTQFQRGGGQRGIAECLIGFGAVAAAEGRASDAARLFGAGEAALAALRTEVWSSNRADYERWLGRARSGRSKADFERTRSEGREWPPDQAVAWVMAHLATGASAASDANGNPDLTPREMEVASLAARGLSNRQIADTLVITEKTAANHLQHILRKLGLRRRAQLAAYAAELGLGTTRESPRVVS